MVQGGIRLPAVEVDSDRAPSPPENFRVSTLGDLRPCDLLQRLHPHHRDSQVKFQSEGHLYFLNDEPAICSVTGLIHKFANPFDADLIIGKMRAGNRWPRPEYLREPMPTSTMAAITNIDVLAAARLQVHQSDSQIDRNGLCFTVRGMMRDEPELCVLLRL